jgi:hypothetical protein
MSDLTRNAVVAYVGHQRAATAADVMAHFGVTMRVASAHLERAFNARKLVRERLAFGGQGARYLYRPMPATVPGVDGLVNAARERLAEIATEAAKLDIERAALEAYIATLAPGVHV